MKKQMFKRVISALLCVVMCFGSLLTLWGCGGTPEEGGGSKTKPDALVVMTEELDGLFNPFYSTTANDSTIVAMTQIGMLSTGTDSKGDVIVAYGDKEAVAVKDYESVYDKATKTTTYNFVIKNGIKFSDGKPLTINDVLFNLYVYLDPVYTGSSTMYSTDIQGLQAYRTQKAGADDNADEELTSSANSMAKDRIDELKNVYKTLKDAKKDTDYSAMKAAIQSHSLSSGYKNAVSADPSSVTNAQLLKDYDYILKLFKEELERDYDGAASNFADVEPYKSYKALDFTDPIVAFMMLWDFVELTYPKEGGKPDMSRIEKHYLKYGTNIDTKEEAIQLVYDTWVESYFDIIISGSESANKVRNEYAANVMQIMLQGSRGDDGKLAVPNISGIKSLSHNSDLTSIKVNGTNYNIAQAHNADGTVKNANEYDVLQITINGVDPKAIWNFAFVVAPQHYYAEGYSVNIDNNNFGVEFASFDFMKNVIQSKNRVPMGAGPYMATNAANESNPKGTEFYANNVVYFKANPHFMMGKAKIEKLRYQVVSSANALSALESGSVHFVSPQFTQNNIDKIYSLESKGIKKLSTDQLGYGYIGINAGKITDINLRKAIMSAMDISLALNYYQTGTAENIYWPMSTVSWAYPKDASGKPDRDNGRTYPALKFSDEEAKKNIKKYMGYATYNESDLEIKFTIAGANMTEHPAYLVFQKAAQLLNECGWNIEVVPDVQALTKLSTGSLEVWAAAWGSTVDPDMYQVYHKDSTATSTLAWGYNVIVDNDEYQEENQIIDALSELIDQARETEDRNTRKGLYKQAMQKVLDLAIELPVYQRDVLYAYDSNVIKESSLPAQNELNPYTSPLDHIWEIEFAD